MMRSFWNRGLLLVVLIGVLGAPGCALPSAYAPGTASAYRAETGYGGYASTGYGSAHHAAPSIAIDARSSEVYATSVTTVAEAAPSRSAPSFWFDGDSGGGTSGGDVAAAPVAMPPPPDPAETRARELYAQAQTEASSHEATATDAVDTSRDLIIYTALFHIAVYQVAQAQATLTESVRAAGGFVFSQTEDQMVLRIPAARFQGFVGQIGTSFDVLHRELHAQDVGEEFHDIEIRLRNLEAMRDRVAALLASATDVAQALAVERELERITGELESLRGRQRYLADHVAFSTITIVFQPRQRDAIDQPDTFPLPFGWLDALGLPQLLELR
jgi:hypothetical protein